VPVRSWSSRVDEDDVVFGCMRVVVLSMLLSCYVCWMMLCIIMLSSFIHSGFSLLSFWGLLLHLLIFFPYGCCSSRCFVLGNIYRMTRCGSSCHGGDDTPVSRSTRQAGHSPEPYQPPPPPPQAPTTEQIMRMFEEKRNKDLMEFLRSMQTMVGQNIYNGNHSKLSDF
jgi:hypothetical protein